MDTPEKTPLKTGTKYDQDKPRVDLLDPEWLEEVGRVLGFGAQKYAAHNWRGGISYMRLLGALLRHTYAILRGEDVDPESGLTHAGHASCCIMFLYWMMKHRKDLDDRWKELPPNPEPGSYIGVTQDQIKKYQQEVSRALR